MMRAGDTSLAMPISEFPDPLRGGDQLRSLENNRFAQRRPGNLEGLAGRKELDRAWGQHPASAFKTNTAQSLSMRPVFVCAVVIGIAAIWTYLLIF